MRRRPALLPRCVGSADLEGASPLASTIFFLRLREDSISALFECSFYCLFPSLCARCHSWTMRVVSTHLVPRVANFGLG